MKINEFKQQESIKLINPKYLITTSDYNLWPSTKEECLLIGDWCINSSVEEYLNKKYYSIIPYHFNDRNNLYDAYIYCKNNYEKLLDDLTLAFNDLYDLKHDKHYYRIMLGLWLWSFVVIFYDRYLSLRKVLDKYPNIPALVIKTRITVAAAI